MMPRAEAKVKKEAPLPKYRIGDKVYLDPNYHDWPDENKDLQPKAGHGKMVFTVIEVKPTDTGRGYNVYRFIEVIDDGDYRWWFKESAILGRVNILPEELFEL